MTRRRSSARFCSFYQSRCHKFKARVCLLRSADWRIESREHQSWKCETRRAFDADVIVVGGGLAGLSAAALVARAGRSVIVVEKSSHLGGRAATHVRDEIHWNLGPHALYCHGHAFRLFRELGISFTGRFPDPGRGLLVAREATYSIPAGIGSFLGSRLLTVREKWRLARCS